MSHFPKSYWVRKGKNVLRQVNFSRIAWMRWVLVIATNHFPAKEVFVNPFQCCHYLLL